MRRDVRRWRRPSTAGDRMARVSNYFLTPTTIIAHHRMNFGTHNSYDDKVRSAIRPPARALDLPHNDDAECRDASWRKHDARFRNRCTGFNAPNAPRRLWGNDADDES